MSRPLVRRLVATLCVAMLSSLSACSDDPAGPAKTAPPATTHSWSQRFGDGSSQQALAVASDASSNVIVVGYFNGTVDFGGGPLTSSGTEDVFVAKFDAGGNHLWSKRYGDGASQIARGVATDGSSIIVVGSFLGSIDFGGGTLTDAGQTDIFVVKLDGDGNHTWSKRFGDGGFQAGAGVAVDLVGNIVIGGRFLGSVDFGGGVITNSGQFSNVYVAKMSPTGMHVWSAGFGDTQPDELTGVTTDHQGNIVAVGKFQNTIDFGGGTLTSAGLSDVFVAKFNASGTHLFSHGYGDNTTDEASAVATDSQGRMIVTGRFFGSIDFGGGPLVSAGSGDIFVVKLNPGGVHEWSRRFGDGSNQNGLAVSVDGSNNIAITGTFEGAVDFGGGAITSAGGLDLFLARFTSNGTHTRSDGFGDGDDQHGTGVAYDAQGDVNLAGYFRGNVNFGGGTLASAGSDDIYCTQFKP